MNRVAPALNPKTAVFLVDDHPIVRRGLQLLLEMEPDFFVCGEADNEAAAAEKISSLRPEIVIVDLSLKSGSGLGLIKRLRTLLPNLKILVFSMQADPIYAERALRAGAKGYITKEDGAEKAIEAVRVLKSGKSYFSPQVASALMQRMVRATSATDPLEKLSDRELQVLRMLGQGLATRDISERLHVSIKTVESHREHIKIKLGMRRASELTNFAFRWLHEH